MPTAAVKLSIPLTEDIQTKQITHSAAQQQQIITQIKTLLKQKNAVLIAHYYVAEEIQQLAEVTGGLVSDSLDMAKYGRDHKAQILVVAGVKFMGETAKILSPEKTVLMPDLNAECSLDLGCDAVSFKQFCDLHPERKIVVYSNTSATVKAFADFVVTSGIAVKLISKLKSQGEKIIWAPDKHLGNYLQKITGADMLLWDASCVVHDEFKAEALTNLLTQNPEAAVLVHPESPAAIIQMADVVGSTTQLINAAQSLPQQTLIVATDKAIFYKMKQVAPNKKLLPAPTFGDAATCVSCAHCPWMAMNNLDNLLQVLQTNSNQIFIEEKIRLAALKSTARMFEFI